MQETIEFINEELTEVTVFMKSKADSKILEEHIVKIKYNTEKSEAFKNILNKNGKIEFNCPKFETVEDLYIFIYLVLGEEYDKLGIMIDNISEDLTKCDVTLNDETHTVEIEFNYDKEIYNKLKTYIDKFPKDLEYFSVQDMELINYWINSIEKDDRYTLIKYSGELKKYLEYSNFDMSVEVGAGDDSPYFTEQIGMTLFSYNGKVYYLNAFTGARAEHVIYVPEDTADTKEALMEAAQKRINEYVGEEGKAVLSYDGKLSDVFYKALYETSKVWWQEDFPNLTFEEWLNEGAFVPVGNTLEEQVQVEGVTDDTEAFILTVNTNGKSQKFNVIIMKDNEKMIKPTYKTSDMETKIEISSESAQVPLDTAIEVQNVTSGSEYERITKILDVENKQSYDLKLYSSTLNEYVTKIENGMFEVKLPISKELEGKNLIVYYVDAEGKVTEHEVKVEGGYATFKTDHFSIYTLAEKKVKEEIKDNTITNSKGEKDETPKTGTSDVMCYVLILTIISILGMIVILKRNVNSANE